MSAPRIPPRQPIGDWYHGVVNQVQSHTLLAPRALPDAAVLHEGQVMLRYGVQYAQKPLSIVPGLIAADYGTMYNGENAWHFLLHRSNLYPRADVIGYRSDGEDDMVTVKSLDLMRPLDVLAYVDDQATKPLAVIQAVIADPPDDLPQRLRDYATIFPTFAAWQEAHS